MKQKIILIILCIISFSALYADDAIRFTVKAPSTVILDRPFQLVYTINTSANAKDIRMPDLNDFNILAGPFQSNSSSFQIINGQQSSSVATTITYTLEAKKTGTFTISPANITVKGEKYTANGVSIKVLPPDEKSDSQTPQSQRQQGGNTSIQEISSENLFIKTQISKNNVYEQEPILVTYKLYTIPDVVQAIQKKMPDFNGFLKQELEQPGTPEPKYENYNGRNYITFTLYQELLYPQRAGSIRIDDAHFDLVLRVQNRTSGPRSIFDDFFDSYSNVSKSVVASGVTVTVKELPSNKPASFNGTVGQFSLTSSISAEQIKANEAVTIKININGSGNMKMIKNPEINFPNGLEPYDPKVTNKFKNSASGLSGTKTIEYMFIPRVSGDFEIPTIQFSYFDIQDKTYKTLSTPVYKLKVLKGDTNENSSVVTTYANKEDIKQLGNDIRYIHTGKILLAKKQDSLFGTITGWLMYLIPLFIALVLFVLFRKYAKDNADIKVVRNKKANKVATKRLKDAQKLLSQGKKDQFYDEVLKASWTYLSDKLSIPLASLTKENVDEELKLHHIDESLILKMMHVLNTCEYARYAPNTGQEEMGNLYDDAIDTISKLEESIKKK